MNDHTPSLHSDDAMGPPCPGDVLLPEQTTPRVRGRAKAAKARKTLPQRISYSHKLGWEAFKLRLRPDGTLSDEMAEALMRKYDDLFIIPEHSGSTVRKPTKLVQTAQKSLIQSGEIIPPIRYALAPKLGRDGKVTMTKSGDCCMSRNYQGWYFGRRLMLLSDPEVCVPRASTAVEPRLLPEVKESLIRDAQLPLTASLLVRHLVAGTGGHQHTRWAYLHSDRDTLVPYVVLDLDDKSACALLFPSTPTSVIARMLDLLRKSAFLHPDRALQFSSPGGRGRHLYYFLDRPMPAVAVAHWVNREVIRLARLAGLEGRPKGSAPGWTGMDIFPTGSPRATMQALPLGRTGWPCMPDGTPWPAQSLEEVVIALRDQHAQVERLSLDDLARSLEGVVEEEREMEQPVPPVVSSGSPSTSSAVSVLRESASFEEDEGSIGEDEEDSDEGDDGDATNTTPPRAFTDQDRAQAEALLRDGLTGPSQRHDACVLLLRHCRHQGMPRVVAVSFVQEWLRNHHNGHSVDYNEDPEGACQTVDALWGMASLGVMTSLPALYLTKRQVAFLGMTLLTAARNGGGLTLRSSDLRHVFSFTVHLAACILRYTRAGMGMDEDRSGEPLVARVAAKVLSLFPIGGSPRTREKYLSRLRTHRLAWVDAGAQFTPSDSSRAKTVPKATSDSSRATSVSKATSVRKATRYGLSQHFPPVNGEDLVLVSEAIDTFLADHRSDFFDKRSWSRFQEARRKAEGT